LGGGSVLVPEQPAKIASTKATLETNCTLVLTLFSPVTFPCDYSDCAAHTRSASSSFHLMVPPAAHFCSEKSWQPDTMNCVISVIIPTLNEGRYLGATLQRLAQNAPQHEIIVSDGGSTDETVQIAGQYGPKVVASALTSPPVTGRALQMNSGARSATGEILLFLHADTHLRSTSLRQIEMALQNPAAVGTGLRRRSTGSPLSCGSVGGWQPGGVGSGDGSLGTRRFLSAEPCLINCTDLRICLFLRIWISRGGSLEPEK